MRGELFVVNSAGRRRSSSFACKCESRIFTQQKFNSCWVLFFVVNQISYEFYDFGCVRRSFYVYPPTNFHIFSPSRYFAVLLSVELYFHRYALPTYQIHM